MSEIRPQVIINNHLRAFFDFSVDRQKNLIKSEVVNLLIWSKLDRLIEIILGVLRRGA